MYRNAYSSIIHNSQDVETTQMCTGEWINKMWSSHCGAVEKNPTSIYEDVGSIPGLTLWVKGLELPQAMVYVTDAA